MCTICQSLRAATVGCDYADLPKVAAAPLYSESVDAGSGTATAYSVMPGSSFAGVLSSASDTDWIRIDLSAGQTIAVTMTGSGTQPLQDPFLNFYDGSGRLIASDDDSGGGLNAKITFVAQNAGSYYIEAKSYNALTAGGYSVSIAAPTMNLPVYSLDQIANQLTTGYWQAQGGDWAKWAVAPGGTISVDISGLSAAGQNLARWALNAWTSVTGINFAIGGSGASIVIDDNDSGAYSTFQYSNHTISSAQVNVSTAWLSNSGTSLDSYSLQTFIHEIGHALGLGHAGNYNGNATWGIDNSYLNDSWQATVMSYFSQTENSYINASFAFLMTPMLADIIAMQQLYGVASSLRSGNTVYGDGSNAGGIYDQAAAHLANPAGNAVAFTIADQGGWDTINFGSDTGAQVIDLRPGTASSVYGGTGNVLIAQGTWIERIFAGSASDQVTGNSLDNHIYGGAGNDRLLAGDGNDRVYGGTGADVLGGGNHQDVLYGDGGNDQLYGADGNDTLWAGDGNDTLSGGNGNDFLHGGLGADVLTGNSGADEFRFYSVTQSTSGSADTITDFVSGTDKIDLRTIDASTIAGGNEAFSFIGGAGFNAAGQVRFVFDGTDGWLQGDVNGDGVADLMIRLSGVSSVQAGDLLL